jgi:hypothetical protein
MKDSGETSIGVILAVGAIVIVGALLLPAIVEIANQAIDMMTEGVNNMDSFMPGA